MSLLALMLLDTRSRSQSTVTVGDPTRPAELQSDLQAAIRSGAQHITIEPGRYVLPRGNDWATLAFHNLNGVEIEAYGVDLAIDSTDVDAVGFYGCDNVTFRGATVHYAVPHTGQGTIVAMGQDDAGSYYDVHLDRDYPQDADFHIAYVMARGARTMLPGSQDMSAVRIEPLPAAAPGAPSHVRIHWNGHYGLPENGWNVHVGDSVACRGPGAMMIHLDGCSRCTVQDVTLFWGGIFGYFETGGAGGNRYLRDRVTFGPPPPGAVRGPLLSQSADGLHSSGTALGPDVEGCSFVGMPDDGIAVHGVYEQVQGFEDGGSTLIVATTRNRTQFAPGDPIRVDDGVSGQIWEAHVLTAAPRDDADTPAKPSRFHPFRDPAALHHFALTLDRPIPAPFDALAADPARCGAGYRLLDNTIRNHRARGMLLKADNGLVQNNTIDGSSIAGIVISPETWWGEAGYSHNVRILGNTVRNTGYAATGPGTPQAGSITITGESCQGNRYILLQNNTIANSTGADLVIRWSQHVTVADNTFDHSHQNPDPAGPVGHDTGIDPASIIWIGDSTAVTLKNNRAIAPGPGIRSVVSLSPTAKQVTGQHDGVRTDK
jgi:hypothetical protein